MNAVALSVCAGAISVSALAQEALPTRIGFEERAVDAGLGFNHVQMPLRPWAVMGTGGVAADFNNDGWMDLFAIGGGDTPDALFINLGIGPDGKVHFEDQSARWGCLDQHYGFGASAADFDKDGDLDLFMTSFGSPTGSERNGKHRLYRNDLLPDGTRLFVDVAVQAGVNQNLPEIAEGLGSAWGDPDMDGDLDLFVTGYLPNYVANRMYRNNGNGTFQDVTVQWGLDDAGCSGFVPGFVDMYGNGRPDLLLVADTGTSRFYLNKGLDERGVPKFIERGAFFEDLNTTNGMGSAVGDMNNDGRLDWYVSSIYFDSTGGPGNVLMIQNEDRTFTNIAHEVGVADGRWGWGVLMVDFDHDRDLDLAEVNGWPAAFNSEPSFLHEQTGPLEFNPVSAESGFDLISEGRGLINADFDNDGDEDMVVFNVGGPMFYYENTLLTPGAPVPADLSWLRIEFETSARDHLPPDGIHTSMIVSAGGVEQMLYIDGGFSHCSQGEVSAHVGLGDATKVDWVRISWADKSTVTLENIEINQILKISATAYAADLNDDGIIDMGDLFTLVERYLSGSMTADITGNGILDIGDLTRFVAQFIEGI